MSIDPYRQSTRDDVMTSALVSAAGNLLDDLVDRLLRTDERVATAAQGKLLIAADDGMEDVADRVQRFVAVATPAVRVLARGARFTRVPWVLVASTAVSLTTTLRAGVRELRVLGSLLAHRLEQATGTPPDPALVTKLAVELYLAPSESPTSQVSTCLSHSSRGSGCSVASSAATPAGRQRRRWTQRSSSTWMACSRRGAPPTDRPGTQPWKDGERQKATTIRLDLGRRAG